MKMRRIGAQWRPWDRIGHGLLWHIVEALRTMEQDNGSTLEKAIARVDARSITSRASLSPYPIESDRKAVIIKIRYPTHPFRPSLECLLGLGTISA